MNCEIILTQEQSDWADRLALARCNAAISNGRVPRNDAPTDFESRLAADKLGTRGELAGYLFFKPVKWLHFAERVCRAPDYEDFIDAKTIDQHDRKLMVSKDDPPDWAYLLVIAAPHPRYVMHGWAWGKNCQHPKFWWDPTGHRPAYFVPQRDPILNDPGELVSIVRYWQRQKGNA